MCTHNKWIKNPYTGELLYVKCGVCPSCQMEKSSRLYSRISNHEASGRFFRLFITLNYSNDAVPYVLFDECSDESCTSLKVYRSCDIRWRKKSGKGRNVKYELVNRPGRVQIGELPINPYDFKKARHTVCDGLVEPQKFTHHYGQPVAVCFTRDFSLFIKRFKKYCKDYYNIILNNENFSYFKVQEYGPTTLRPHFHTIFYLPPSLSEHYQQLRRAIIKAWPFCSLRQLEENIGVAIEGKSYVSKYTVRSSTYPEFLKIRTISQKNNFSRGFGCRHASFAPSEILKDIDRRDFLYPVQTFRDNHPLTILLPIPKYALHQYFPPFKGLHKLNTQQSFALLSCFGRVPQFYGIMGLSPDEVKMYSRRLMRAALRLGLSSYDYAILYLQFKRSYFSFCERQSLIGYDFLLNDKSQYVDNPLDIIQYTRSTGEYITDLLPDEYYLNPCEHLKSLDPNKYTYRVVKERQDLIEFENFRKKAKFNDYVASLKVNYITYKRKRHGKHFKKAIEAG